MGFAPPRWSKNLFRTLRTFAAPEPQRSSNQGCNRPHGQSWGRSGGAFFQSSYRFLGLPRVRPCPTVWGRASGVCARGTTVIRLHALQSRFIPDGAGMSLPFPHRAHLSPGCGVVDSAGLFMTGKLSHAGPAGNNRRVMRFH
jgi:hypothetical protein